MIFLFTRDEIFGVMLQSVLEEEFFSAVLISDMPQLTTGAGADLFLASEEGSGRDVLSAAAADGLLGAVLDLDGYGSRTSSGKGGREGLGGAPAARGKENKSPKPSLPLPLVTFSRDRFAGADLLRPFCMTDFLSLCRERFSVDSGGKNPGFLFRGAFPTGRTESPGIGNWHADFFASRDPNEEICVPEEKGKVKDGGSLFSPEIGEAVIQDAPAKGFGGDDSGRTGKAADREKNRPVTADAPSPKEFSGNAGEGNYALREVDYRLEETRLFCLGEEIFLTPTERRLFSLLLERRGEAVPAEELKACIGSGTGRGNSLLVYIHSLRQKLDFRLGRRLILTERGKGYRLL